MTTQPSQKTLFWDIGGVLLTNGWDRDQRAKVIAQFGLNAGDFNERHKLAVPELELGRMTLDEYLAQTVFCRPQDFSREDFRRAMEAESQPDEAALSLAHTLGARYRMYSLNNEGHDLNEYRIRTYGLREFLLGFFTSCYLGVMKPNPAIYRLGLKLAQVDAGNAVMIDDRLQNVEAARSVGMHAIQFVSAEQLRADLAALGVQ